MNTRKPGADFLVIGGGVIGISIARELKRRHSDQSVCLLEKEAACGLHASGRNSGVILAGFYYPADSLKAKFTRDGNRLLVEYCEGKKIPVNKCGKLVVTKNASELSQLDELARRGAANGVTLQTITPDEMREIEPRAKTYERAIFSPATSTADPLLVIESMRADAIAEGVRIEQNSGYLSRKGTTIFTKSGEIEAGYVVNAAGLYADKVARDFGLSEHYRIVPFKGIYLYSEEPAGAFRTNIYPVPDLRNPFLGVHFTVTVDGHAKIGPTAIPAFWREQYGAFEGFEPAEFLEIVSRELGLIMFSGFDFKRLAVEELLKYSKSHLVSLAAHLAEGVRVGDYKHWGRPGIRAQLMDTRTRKLEMDFVLESNEKSMHVLNAVSPGWTCAIPFAQFVVDKINGSAN